METEIAYVYSINLDSTTGRLNYSEERQGQGWFPSPSASYDTNLESNLKQF